MRLTKYHGYIIMFKQKETKTKFNIFKNIFRWLAVRIFLHDCIIHYNL